MQIRKEQSESTKLKIFFLFILRIKVCCLLLQNLSVLLIGFEQWNTKKTISAGSHISDLWFKFLFLGDLPFGVLTRMTCCGRSQYQTRNLLQAPWMFSSPMLWESQAVRNRFWRKNQEEWETEPRSLKHMIYETGNGLPHTLTDCTKVRGHQQSGVVLNIRSASLPDSTLRLKCQVLNF